LSIGAAVDTNETMTLLNKQTGELETRNIHTGELVVTEGDLTSSHIYSVEICDAICNLIREGYTYTSASKAPGMPPLYLIYQWLNRHPEFKKKAADARRDRATFFHDEAVRELGETADREDVPVGKFKFDGYMKLAEKGNPDEYGQKTAALGQMAPTMIVINTGINRDEPITVEGVYDGQGSDGARRRESSEQRWPLGAEVEDPEIDRQEQEQREEGEGAEERAEARTAEGE